MTQQTQESASSKKQARFHNPQNVLREKVGTGGLEVARLAKADNFIDDNKTDFVPLAREILTRIAKATAQVKAGDLSGKEGVNKVAAAIMEMKAAGGMFNYRLASEIASLILSIVETMDEMSEDGFHLINVQQKTLEAIVKHRLAGDGGATGQALAKELFEACQRYRKKYPLPVEPEK
jgi:hypothetical protein